MWFFAQPRIFASRMVSISKVSHPGSIRVQVKVYRVEFWVLNRVLDNWPKKNETEFCKDANEVCDCMHGQLRLINNIVIMLKGFLLYKHNQGLRGLEISFSECVSLLFR